MLWFGASGFEILDVVDGGELVVSMQTTATVVGCSACGTKARRPRIGVGDHHRCAER